MELAAILKIVFLGLAHWMLVPMALQSLAERPKVLGGRKAPWALEIVFLTCFGSLFYMLLHPQPQTESERGEGNFPYYY